MTDRTARVQRQPARNGSNAGNLPSVHTDPFEAADDWIFVVCNHDDVGVLARCTHPGPGLNVEPFSPTKKFDRWVKARRIIVPIPGKGPRRDEAIEAAARCRANAAKVIEWQIEDWGGDDTPDLATYHAKYGLAKILNFDRPWVIRILPGEASPANRNGYHDGTADDGTVVDADRGVCIDDHSVVDDVRDPIGDVDHKAFHGILGKLALATQPETEANALFVLLHLLAFFGTAVGRGPHFIVSASVHYLNLFVGLIGSSGFGRKGTAAHVAKQIWRKIDATFTVENITDGLNSGAGLLYHLRDPSERIGKNGTVTDEGVKDKSRVFLESELSSVLMQGHRENDPLLGHLRKFFDGEEIVRSNTKDPTKVTGGHVSAVGHCTPADLEIHLSDADKANGTANRFLWVFGVRSKLLPRGGDVFDLLDNFLGSQLQELRDAVSFAKGIGKMRRSAGVEARWEQLYREFNDIPPGRIGGFFVRAPTIILRVASIFALADSRHTIEMDHLEAALAIWEHSARSLRWIFRSDVDPRAEKLLAALKETPAGLNTRQILHDVFKKNVDAETIHDLLLRQLANRSIEAVDDDSKKGRPGVRYRRKVW